MKTRINPFLRRATIVTAATIAFAASAQGEILSFDGNVASGVTTHTINATDWADYVGGATTFNSANDWGRLYWRGSAGDGQYIHFDLSTLTGLTLVAPATVTLQNANPTWGGSVNDSFVATANSAWTAGAGQTIPGATAITNAVNATGSYGSGASVSWGIGSTTFESIVAAPGSYHGLAVIGGPGSQLHFTGPASPYLTVKTGTLSSATGIITADTGATTWNASNYGFVGANSYSPALNTLTITGELAPGTSGAGSVTINNGGTVAVSQAGSANYYWALDGTTINTGGKLTSNGHSNIHNLPLAGGELASTGTDGTFGGWSLADPTTVTGGVTSTISAQQVNLDASGVFNVDAGSALDVTGSFRIGSLTKNGAGSMKLNTYNNFTGGTTVNNGTLELAGQNSGYGWLRGAVTVNAGGTLALTGGDGTGFGWNSPINSLTVDGGTVTANSAHIGFGAITVALNNGGTISGYWNWNGDGGLNFSSSGDSTNTISGALNLRSDGGANHTFNVAEGAAAVDLQVSANLTDQYPEVWWVPASALVKTGAGTMVLSGNNSYNGSTTVSAGKLAVSGDISTSSITVQAGAAFEFAGTTNYVGPITVDAGTLTLNNPVIDDASSLVITSGSTVNLNFTGNDTVGSLAIDGSGPLPAGTYNSSHPTYGSYFTGAGSLVIAGASGTWTSLVDGNWGTDTNWQSNIIAAGYDATATFNAATGVTVTLDSNKIIGNLAFDVSDYTLAGANTLTLDSSTIPAISVGSGHTATISATLAGIYGMEKTGAGHLLLTGVKTYTGGTTVTNGTLELSGGNSGNSIIRGALTISPGATVDITNGDGSGFGWNNPVTSTTVNGGTLNAASGCHLGFGSAANMVLDNGASLQGSWQWNGDGGLSFTSYGDSTNTISGALNLRADSGASHTFFVDDGASATDLQINANLSDQWPEINWVPASGLTKSGAGTLALNGTNTFDGNTVINEGVLSITASGSLHFRPTTNGVSNSVSATGTGALSFAGTVDLDLNAAVAADGNVWNLFNLASFAVAPDLSSVAAVTSTLGSFSEVTPGTWELPVTGAKWVFTESNGNLAYEVTATDYDDWASANGVTGGANDDDDADGLTNFEEYAFGLDPTGGSSVNAIAVPLDKTSGTFSYTRRTQSLTGLAYSVWYSTDLSVWNEDTGAVEGTPVVTGEVETVPVTLSGALLSNSKLFIQVRAE
jgi:autotransporter-associated beta strand protein